MGKNPIWRGSKQLTPGPNNPIQELDKTGQRYIMIFSGPYSACVAGAPGRGVSMAGIPPEYTVDTVRVERQPGGSGKLTITLVSNPEPGLEETISEIDWTEVQKNLDTHPIFNPTDENSKHPNAGKYALNMADRNAIEAWKNAASAQERADAYSAASASGEGSELTGNAAEFIKRLMRGQDSYVVYSPVARQITKSATKPSTTNCGLISEPPAEVKATGYVYLQTADHGTRDFNWTRTIEWTGSDYVDDELYPHAPS